MRTLYKAVTAMIVGALALLAVLTPAVGQGATGTVNVSVRYCTQLLAPAQLPGDPAEGCGPGPAQFSFYLVGDGTSDFELLTIDTSGQGTITLPVGEYEVIEENTQVRLSVFVEANQTSSFVFGFPAEAQPETPSGTLNLNTYACPGVTAVAVTSTVGADCVRFASTLSFYLVGDGTDVYFAVYTSASETAVVGLPVGNFEVVDEPTQAHVAVSVVEGTTTVNIVFPLAQNPVTPTPVATVVPTAAAAPAAAVTGLPKTGSGAGSNVAALGAVVAGAVLTAGAIGLRLRDD